MSRSRPLSPHLSVYKLPITAWLSITHRITGVLLLMGLTLFTWLLISLHWTSGQLWGLLDSWIGVLLVKVVIGGCVAALCYHYYNGIRHLFWDCGIGFSKSEATFSGWLMLGFAVTSLIGLGFIGFFS
ncbi:Succinate dehydrogenase cytochrome b556 subunit [Anaplasma phagocytophilum]|uniref:Succinate dehydrogenase cytochrome b556 subunit n=2 Tax=Anaplasma phagocytophilum TaxID=948 RepID=A0A7H9DZG7_ANAPH|nr:succinate dehydrogenase, cytochrome b556 subunit [Anaplasma phagocytophilum]QLL66953.1 succinate dehydrogenase, cytochrome b556 subunit [Anaplasma phagocytophilum str. Norway variant1]UVU20924.1 succinate dehydrogenase subunit C [Anaplasma phagocytophilum]SCV64618.1 Succinate dehydrogenase cytochrome b556 subunit [Anaplasma phagocytophilum]SCV64800.1 Succinate dehydrogenase cytochrome b556 subunit [Anaplasma phagocytophilum]